MRRVILLTILLTVPAVLVSAGCDDRARIREERAVDRMGVLYRRCVSQNGFNWGTFETRHTVDRDSKYYSRLYVKCLAKARREE